MNVWRRFLIILLFSSSILPHVPITFAESSTEDYTLALTVAPPILPADGKKYEAIFVQVQKAGRPILAPSDIRILISSSDVEVGQVDPDVILRKDEPYAIVRFDTTTNSGITNITTSANDFDSVTAQLSTAKPAGVPSKIRMRLSPEAIPAEEGESGLIVVELQDPYGSPVRAPADLRVEISSSNSDIVTVSPDIIIPEGSFSGIAQYQATYLPGSVMITASSVLGTAVAAARTSGQVPTNLTVFVMPNRLPAGTGQTAYIVIQMQDREGKPVAAPSDTSVFLSSSNPDVANVEDLIEISQGSTFAIAELTTGPLANSTLVSATAPGFTSASTRFEVLSGARSPESLKLYLSPNEDIADPRTSPLVAVQLLDKDGLPALATQDVTVSILSSNLKVADVERSTVILTNTSFNAVRLSLTYHPGLTTLTASAQRFRISDIIFRTTASLPTKLSVPRNDPDFILPADREANAELMVQLQDADGNPAKASSDTTVLASSSDAQVLFVPSSFLIPRGSTAALLPIRLGNLAGSATITFYADGLPGASLEITTIAPHPSRLAVYPTLALFPAENRYSSPVIVQIQDADGNPAVTSSNAVIAVSSSNSTIGSISSLITLLSGESLGLTYFQPSGKEGSTTITVQASGYLSSKATLKTLSRIIPISPTSSSPPPSTEPILDTTINTTSTQIAHNESTPPLFSLFGIDITQDFLMLVIPAAATPLLGVILFARLRERSKKPRV